MAHGCFILTFKPLCYVPYPQGVRGRTERNLKNMANYLYTKEYGQLTVQVLEKDINDLSEWSAFNGDEYLTLIEVLKDTISVIKREMEQK
jgi:hypothetical protein